MPLWLEVVNTLKYSCMHIPLHSWRGSADDKVWLVLYMVVKVSPGGLGMIRHNGMSEHEGASGHEWV